MPSPTRPPAKIKSSPRTKRPALPTPEPGSAAPSLPQNDKPTRPWAHLLGPGLVLLLALLAYAPTLGNGFAYDDTAIIQENPVIRSLRNLPRMLVTDYWGTLELPDVFHDTRLYRPLVIVSFALNYALGGLHPLGYHVVNLLLHAGVSLAVYGVGAQLLGLPPAGAAVAAALFAVHPLHTEAVAGIVGRAELFMALGVLLALWGYRRGDRLGHLGSLLAFALGLLAKEQAVVLPGLLLLHELVARRLSARPARWPAWAATTLIRLLPYLGLLAAYFLLRAWVLGGRLVPSASFLANPLAHVPLGPRLLTALAVAGRYLTLMIWPAPLSPDYSYNQIPLITSPLAWPLLWAALLWGGLLGLGGRSFLRGRGTAGFAVGFTLLSFLPASNLLVPIGTIMGERLFYLPSVGLCWLAGLAWAAGATRLARPRLRQAAGVSLGVLLLALTGQSLRYGRIWRDDLTLFSYAVQAVPRSAVIRFNLGSALLFEKDRKEEAITHLRRAVEIYPRYRQAWDALGRGYLDTKQWGQAIATFKKAMAVDPNYPHPYNNIGLAYVALGRWDEAIAAFRRAVALKPDLAQAHRNLADVYERRGWSEAELAERALELTTTDPLAWLHAGSTFLRLAWPEEALMAFREAVRLDPKLPQAQLALAQAYDRLVRPREAAQAYEALLQLRPALPAVHRRLAELYTRYLNDPAKAAAHLRQAQETSDRPAGP
jgi:tetratricopeptide (TPR) repeat protein